MRTFVVTLGLAALACGNVARDRSDLTRSLRRDARELEAAARICHIDRPGSCVSAHDLIRGGYVDPSFDSPFVWEIVRTSDSFIARPTAVLPAGERSPTITHLESLITWGPCNVDRVADGPLACLGALSQL